jgi:diadenosine tetraphosphate (Ap4A) HIT family hydrolase
VSFTLHPRLEADTKFVADLVLCRVQLMNDARFPWLILIPRRTALRELADVHPEERLIAYDDIERASRALRDLYEPARVNVAAIGNIINQLHIHVVARTTTDAAWPGVVWGHGTAEPYDDAALAQRLGELRAVLSP